MHHCFSLFQLPFSQPDTLLKLYTSLASSLVRDVAVVAWTCSWSFADLPWKTVWWAAQEQNWKKIIEAVFHASLNVIIRYISQVNSSSKTTKNTINTAVKCWMLKSIPISLDLILLSIKRSVANEHAPEMLLYQDWKQVRPIISQSSAFSLLYYQMWCICCLHYFNKKCT